MPDKISSVNAPIGFLDSGLGGVTVLRDAMQALPDESFLYLGDNANAPYGEKSREEIETLTLAAAWELRRRGAKVLVVACNTATSAAITLLRKQLPIPVVGMEPALKPAWAMRVLGKVLVMATPATLRLDKFRDLSQRVAQPDGLLLLPCAPLVPLIEEGIWQGSVLEECLEKLLESVREEPIDVAVLGCTHYLFIREAISNALKVPLVDGNPGTIARLNQVLDESQLRATSQKSRSVAFFTTGDPARYAPVIKILEKTTGRLDGVMKIALDKGENRYEIKQ